MPDLIWTDPPLANGRTDWYPIAATLRERPGQWALVLAGVSNHGASRNIRAGIIKAFAPAGSFDARCAKTGDGFDIYARFVGQANA